MDWFVRSHPARRQTRALQLGSVEPMVGRFEKYKSEQIIFFCVPHSTRGGFDNAVDKSVRHFAQEGCNVITQLQVSRNASKYAPVTLDNNNDGDTFMEAAGHGDGARETHGFGFDEADTLINESPEQQPGTYPKTVKKDKAPTKKKEAQSLTERRSTLATMDSSSQHFQALMHLAGDPAFVLRRIQQQQQQQQHGSLEPEQGYDPPR
ncbi:hypothetical protein FA10DRAFT_263362, partial [Acaromyces ingoldii]